MFIQRTENFNPNPDFSEILTAELGSNAEGLSGEIERAATELSRFFAALTNPNPGRAIDCRCIREPKGNLDSGRHYFSVGYSYTEDGFPYYTRLWPYCDEIAAIIGFDVQNRIQEIDKFCFHSGAIGMSRMLDATDGLAYFFKKHTGVYFQF